MTAQSFAEFISRSELQTDRPFNQRRLLRKFRTALRERASLGFDSDQIDAFQSTFVENFQPKTITPEALEELKTKARDAIFNKRENAKAFIDEQSSLPEDQRTTALRNKLSSSIQDIGRPEGLKGKFSDKIISFKTNETTPVSPEDIKTKARAMISSRRENAKTFIDDYSSLPEDQKTLAVRNGLLGRIQDADSNPIVASLLSNNGSLLAGTTIANPAGLT